jgi:hypothetical protein
MLSIFQAGRVVANLAWVIVGHGVIDERLPPGYAEVPRGEWQRRCQRPATLINRLELAATCELLLACAWPPLGREAGGRCCHTLCMAWKSL